MKKPDDGLKFLLIFCLCAIFCAIPAMAADIVVERNLSTNSVQEGGDLAVTLSVQGMQAGGIVETFPAGFAFLSTDVPEDQYRVSGDKILFTVIGDRDIVYHLRAQTVGTWSISGVWDDAVSMTDGAIPNSAVTVRCRSSDGGDDSFGTSPTQKNTTGVPEPDQSGVQSRTFAITGQKIGEVVLSGKDLPEEASVSCESIDLPDDTREAPGEVYQYYNISCEAGNGTVSGAVIRFTVPKAWIEENGFSVSGIVLYHYDDGRWVALDTTMTGTRDDSYTFEARSPGFSLFAIAGKKTDTVTSTRTTQPVTISTPKAKDGGATVAEVKDDDAVGSPVMPLVLGLVGLAVIIGAGVWYMRSHKNKSEKEE